MKNKVRLGIGVLASIGLLAATLIALWQPAQARPAARAECTPVNAGLIAPPPLSALTGAPTINTVTLTQDGIWTVYAVDVKVAGTVPTAFALGAPDGVYFTMPPGSYQVYLDIDIESVGGQAGSQSRVVNGDLFGYGVPTVLDGFYGPRYITTTNPNALGSFYIQLAAAEGNKSQLVGRWKVAVFSTECDSPFPSPAKTPTPMPTPMPTPAPTMTPWFLPTPTPNSASVNIYHLPGNYGVVGRLFDFGIILAVAKGFIDFIGVDNLRDWVALGAAVTVLFTVIASARPTTPTS